jgi:hypothetical protein
MKLRIVVPLLCAVLVAPSRAATITFSGMSGSPGDAAFDSALVPLDVTMTVTGGTAVVQSLAGVPVVISNPALTVNTTGSDPGNPAELRVNFLSGALNDTITLAVWDTNVDPVRVRVQSFAFGNSLIETVNLSILDEFAVLAFSSLGTASYIIITDIGGDGHVLDNISFTSAAVPEPPTFALVGAAVLALVLANRNRQL